MPQIRKWKHVSEEEYKSLKGLLSVANVSTVFKVTRRAPNTLTLIKKSASFDDYHTLTRVKLVKLNGDKNNHANGQGQELSPIVSEEKADRIIELLEQLVSK